VVKVFVYKIELHFFGSEITVHEGYPTLVNGNLQSMIMLNIDTDVFISAIMEAMVITNRFGVWPFHRAVTFASPTLRTALG